MPRQHRLRFTRADTALYTYYNNPSTTVSTAGLLDANAWAVRTIEANNQWTITASTSQTIRITNDDVWQRWIDAGGGGIYYYNGDGRAVVAEDEDARAIRLAAQTERNEQRQIAAARARELLLLWLDDSQKRELEAHRFFTIVGSEGRRYQIHHGSSGNVYQVDERNRPLAKLCAHPADDVPDEDTMLAQKLLLECDEESFLRIANVHRRWDYPDIVAA